MADRSSNEKIKTLLQSHDEAVKAGDVQKASLILREASHLQPDNNDVKKRWLALSNSETASNLFEPLSAFIASGDTDAGQKALQALKQKQLSSQDVTKVYDLVLRPTSKTQLLDEITGTLLSRHNEARKLVVAKLISDPTDVFEELYDQGDETFRAVTAIALDASVWESRERQCTAQKDVFRLCVATLMEAGIERPERAMRAIARQLAVQPDNVADLIDEDVFDVVLSDLDIRLDSSLRGQAMLSTSKMLEATQERGENLFSAFVTGRVGRQTNEDLVVAFSAAAAVFPILPAAATKLFLTDGFVQQLVPNLEKNSDAAAAGKRKSRNLEQAALELLSAACVDKSCREAIDRYCSHWLRNLSEEREGIHKALAALILAKISETSVGDVTAKLSDLVMNGDVERDQAVEGLAYTSLQPRVKEDIAGNVQLMQSLVETLKYRPNAAFGCLTVFANLTAYKPAMTEEQKKVSQLKAYANASKSAPDDPLEDDKHVTARCKKILDYEMVPALVACCKQSTSPTNIALVVKILLALGKEQKHRPKMAQQGAIKLLLQIRERTAKTDKSTNEASLIERNAAHALARLLISVNPAHVFSAALPASSAVSALVPLLSIDQDSEQRDMLPTFEALLALTNLASMNEAGSRDLLLRGSFDRIEDLLFSPTTLVQRATVELVCNLMASPQCVANFADGSADAKRRVQILLALADVDDLPTRRAAGGALAMLTEWDAAVSAVLETGKNGKQGVGVLLSICEDESEEVKHRGFVCVANVVNAPGAVGSKGIAEVKGKNGAEVLKQALIKTRNQEILGLGIEVLKKLAA